MKVLNIASKLAITLMVFSSCSSLPDVPLQKQMDVVLANNQFKPDVSISINEQKDSETVDISFTLTLPERAEFKTQELPLSTIAFLKVSIEGPGISPIYADGADAFDMINNPGGVVVVTVSNVPRGNARIGKISGHDAARNLIAGSEIETTFNAVPPTNNPEISFRTTPAGNIVSSLYAGPIEQKHLASKLDPIQLQNFIDNVTGKLGGAPPYTYTNFHPMFVNSTNIKNDLIANGGDILTLSAANPNYQVTAGNVDVTVAGLVGPDTASIQVTDPSSAISTGVANGANTVGNATPGNWTVIGSAAGYTSSGNLPALVTSGGTVNAGTITFTAVLAPEIDIAPNANDQQTPRVCIKPDGNYATVWQDFRNVNADIYLKHSASGTQRQVTSNGFAQSNPDVAVFNLNPSVNPKGFIVVWQDSRDAGQGENIYFGRYSEALLNQLTANTQITSETTNEKNPRVAYRHGNIGVKDRAMVVWTDDRNAHDDIYSQMINTSTGGLIGVNTQLVVGNQGANQQFPDITAAGNILGGGTRKEFFVVWQDDRAGNEDIYGQRFNESGATIGGEIAISTAAGNQTKPSVAYNFTNDKYVVAWTDTRDGNNNIYVQKIDAGTGGLAGINIQVTSDASNQEKVNIASENAGNTLLITWEDSRNGNVDIFGRKFDASTGALDTLITFSSAANSQLGPVNIFSTAAGKFLSIWEDQVNPANFDIKGRQFN